MSERDVSIDALLERLSDFGLLPMSMKERTVAQTWRELTRLRAEIAALAAEIARLHEALTPSANTRNEYAGQFEFEIEFEGGQSDLASVPWTTIKAIMAAILDRATSRGREYPHAT
jgi:septal ring factor EnvC (AmiA/AmiB activator)